MKALGEPTKPTAKLAAGLFMLVTALSSGISADLAANGTPNLPGPPGQTSASTGPGVPATNHSTDAQVTITAVTPLVTGETDQIEISGTVTNTGDSPLSGEINLRQANRPFSNLTELRRWIDAGVEDYDAWIFQSDTSTLRDPLPPKQSKSFSFSFTAESFHFEGTEGFDWGPFGVLVDIDTVRGSLAVDRTYLIYAPPNRINHRLALTVVLPLTARDGESLEQAQARVTAQAKGSAALPVDWLLDPRLLGSGQPTAEPLTSLITEQATKRCIVALPWGDIDVAVLAQTKPDPTDLFNLARDLSTTALHKALSPTTAALIRNDVLWPSGPVNAALVDFAATVLQTPHLIGDPLPSHWTNAAASPQPETSYSPSTTDKALSSVMQLTGRRAAVATIRPDSDLTTKLLAPTPAGSSQAQESQVMMAELAWQASQGDDNDTAVIVFDRQVDVDFDLLISRLQRVLSLPWVAPTGLESLLNHTGKPRQSAPTGIPTQRGPNAKAITRLNQAVSKLEAFAQITADPGTLTNRYEAALVEPLTLSVDNPKTRQTVAARLLSRLDNLFSQIEVVGGSSVNLISEAGELPVAVGNNLAEPVHLLVSLRPANRSMVADKSVSLTLEAGSQATARLPIRALANGTVAVDVVLSNADGVEIARSASFQVRVHAEWETVGTAIVGGAFALVFAFGLIRSIVRRRARPRGARP